MHEDEDADRVLGRRTHDDAHYRLCVESAELAIGGELLEDGARVGLGIQYGRLGMSIAKSLAVSTLTGETEPVHVTLSIGL